MKSNPVYKMELMVSSRSVRTAMILFAFNGILALAALFNMYSVIAQVKISAEIQYSRFLDLYLFIAGIEFLLLMFIMPAITSSSISGERERQTLDLMLTTMMTPGQIVLGKLFSAFQTMALLIVSSLPIISMVFVYGGVSLKDLGMLVICYAAVALFAGSLGLCFSSLFKRSTLATVCTYGALVAVVAGTYFINTFIYGISQMNVGSSLNAIGSVARQASSGGFVYLLLLNPMVTFYSVVNGQTGGGQIIDQMTKWFGANQQEFLMDHWAPISIAVQVLAACVLLWIAVRAVDPIRKTGRGKR